MFKDYKLLLILAFLGVVLVGISIKDSIDQDYVKHQKEYYKLIGEKDYTIEVKQVNLETAGITMVDRCQSCHIGASNPDAVDFPQPLTYHPPIIAGVENSLHDFNKMGCAICHDGNSRALEFHDAHGEFHGWPESYALLPDKTSQANCFRCHAQEG